MCGVRRIATALLLCAWMSPSPANARQIVKLNVSLSPDRLGASTTLTFGFHVRSTTAVVPSPTMNIDLRLPEGLEIDNSTLGVETCSPLALAEVGPEGCSPNAVMGIGKGLVEIPLGPTALQESVNISMLMGTPVHEHTTMLFYADGESPVSAQVVFYGELLPDSAPYGAHIDTDIPLVQTVPGGPVASVVAVQTTFGPAHLTYYRWVNKQRRSYRPVGMTIPARCHGGFPFEARFRFLDGTSASAKQTVPCPRV